MTRGGSRQLERWSLRLALATLIWMAAGCGRTQPHRRSDPAPSDPPVSSSLAGSAHRDSPSICPAAWEVRFSTRHAVPFDAANVVGVQDIPAGGTQDASSILVQRGRCSTNLFLLVVDEIPPRSRTYRAIGIPPIAGMDLTHEEAVTMETDGLTIIGMTADSLGFRAAKRSGVGKVDFAVVADAELSNIVGKMPQILWAPAISPDGLALYYTVANDPDPNINGIYESVRSATRMPFPRGTRMPDLVQSFGQYVNGLSADHLSIFLELWDNVENGFGTVVLSRPNQSAPFTNPNAPDPPPRVPGMRTRPLSGCDWLIGSCAPLGGGCGGEDICTWAN